VAKLSHLDEINGIDWEVGNETQVKHEPVRATYQHRALGGVVEIAFRGEHLFLGNANYSGVMINF
jgi:hypothetical protein